MLQKIGKQLLNFCVFALIRGEDKTAEHDVLASNSVDCSLEILLPPEDLNLVPELNCTIYWIRLLCSAVPHCFWTAIYYDFSELSISLKEAAL